MYVPNNVDVFTAAFAGALAGMCAQNRVPTSTDVTLYGHVTSVAGAFAEAVDTAWGAILVPTRLDLDLFESASEGEWANRSTDETVSTLAATYTLTADGIRTIVFAARAYYLAQGITPPPLASPGLLQTGSDLLTVDAVIGAAAPLVSVTLANTQAGSKFLIHFAGASFTNIPAALSAVRLNLDGVPQPLTSRASASNTQFVAVGLELEVSGLAPGAHTFTIEAECFGGGLALYWPISFPVYLGASMIVEEVAV